MNMRSKVALKVFLFFYVSFGVFITLTQENIIYQPLSQDFESCVAFSEAEKVIYNGTRMYVEFGDRGTVILYHGNAGSACDRGFYASLFKKEGYGYVIPEYTGYSNDIVTPSHTRIKQDVVNVISYLKDIDGGEKVIVIGESIGTGVASYHVSIDSPDKVLLISPFYSLSDLAKRRFWFYPTTLLVDNAFNNSTLLQNFDKPITIIHGTKDAIIPYKSGKKLFDSLISEDREFASIDGYGHNNLFTSGEVLSAIGEFLR